MNSATVNMASPVVSLTSSPGNSIQQKELPRNAQIYARQRIEGLLKERLNKLGSIRTMDAWLICRYEIPFYSYSIIAYHFKCIMQELRDAGKADKICNGSWWIHKNNIKRWQRS